MDVQNYRKQIIHRPPRYHDKNGKRVMVVPASHKIKTKWDEENIVAHIIANMRIVGMWFPSIMPNFYLESGLYSGLMITMSVPSKNINPEMTFPGDIDMLVIPYERNELLLSKTTVVEIKILRGEKQRPGKSPNKFGYSQASALLEQGFPYVAVGHVIVADDIPKEPNKDMLFAIVGENETITSLDPLKVDSFETDLMTRDFGKLAANCKDDRLGYFAMNYDGIRNFEPLSRACSYNPKCTQELLDQIGAFYEENYRIFAEIPRYSPTDIREWEDRLRHNPEIVPPWEFCRKLFKDKKILTLDTWVIEVDGQQRIGRRYHTDKEDFLFYNE